MGSNIYLGERFMDHGDSQEDVVLVAYTDRTFSYWNRRPYVHDQLKRSLADADCVIVPQEGFRDYEGPIFPVLTQEFFHFLQRHFPEDQDIEICISDDDYRELALHASTLILASAVVTIVVAPILVNLVSEYLKRRIWGGQEDRRVRFEMAVQSERNGDRAIVVSYDGPADEFSERMRGALDNLEALAAELKASDGAETRQLSPRRNDGGTEG